MSDDEILALWSGDSTGTRPVMGKNKVLAFSRALEARIAANGGEPVAWEIATPAGERPSLAVLTSKKPTMDHYAEQGWRVTPLYLAAAPVASGPRYDWSVSGMKQSETGNWVMAGEADSAMAKWISVDERLPTERECVIVFRPDAHHLPACDPNIDVRAYFGNGVFNGIHRVTHWMPLPPPPTEQP